MARQIRQHYQGRLDEKPLPITVHRAHHRQRLARATARRPPEPDVPRNALTELCGWNGFEMAIEEGEEGADGYRTRVTVTHDDVVIQVERDHDRKKVATREACLAAFWELHVMLGKMQRKPAHGSSLERLRLMCDKYGFYHAKPDKHMVSVGPGRNDPPSVNFQTPHNSSWSVHSVSCRGYGRSKQEVHDDAA